MSQTTPPGDDEPGPNWGICPACGMTRRLITFADLVVVRPHDRCPGSYGKPARIVTRTSKIERRWSKPQ